MPPKKKAKIDVGQKTLGYQLQLQTASSKQPVEQAGSSSASIPQPLSHCGCVQSWQAFNSIKYKNKHDWLLFKPDGIYCLYCSRMKLKVQSGSLVFIYQPFTGIRPDKLVQQAISSARNKQYALQRKFIKKHNT